MEKSFPLLNAVALTLKGNPEISLIEVQGHTDDRGESAYNLDLSNRRANAVLTFIAGKGIARDRLTARGYGETKPSVELGGRAGQDLEAARSKNRRVQFKILKKKK
jgi:outer membrane protein OmpA-like peptidoglycan-associated protein